MLHPIGPLPPSVYWRRRVLVAALLVAVVLLIVTLFALMSSGKTPVAGSSASSGLTTTPGSSTSSTSPTSPASPAGSTPATTPATSAASSPTSPGTATASTPPCDGAQLTVTAATSALTYKVGDQPILMLKVANNGPGNCTQDLADSQVELRVYNGAARVWGSHDCEVQPGTDVKTLVVGTTVGVEIVWSGLSSEPACAGTRQRVGAGTYTLYALLGGHQGVPAQFTISGP